METQGETDEDVLLITLSLEDAWYSTASSVKSRWSSAFSDAKTGKIATFLFPVILWEVGGGLMTLSVSRHHVIQQDGWLIWKVVEGNGRGPTEVLSWHSPEGTEENHENAPVRIAVFLPWFELCTYIIYVYKRYLQTSLFGTMVCHGSVTYPVSHCTQQKETIIIILPARPRLFTI